MRQKDYCEELEVGTQSRRISDRPELRRRQ